MASYATDYKDYIPREGKYNERHRAYYPWPRAFHQYVTNRLPYIDEGEGQESFETFSNTDLDSSDWRLYRYADMVEYQCPSHPNPLHNIHYINNGLLTKSDGTIDEFVRHPTALITEFVRPSDAMYITEFSNDIDNSIWEGQQSYPYIDHWYDVWAEVHVNGPEEGSDGIGGNVARIKSDRHLDSGSNAIFVDSHVERRERDTLKDVENWDDHTYGYDW